MIQTYFGNGKGKTTAAVGAAIRCNGCGNKVLFAQFLKNNTSSELIILNSLDGVEVLCSQECYKLFDNQNKERTKALTNAYNKLLFEDVKNKADTYQMIVLDEVLDAIEFGYIDEEKFLQLLLLLKDTSEIIITGHKLNVKIKDISDYVSEIKEIKHPYNKGALPRKGIEF